MPYGVEKVFSMISVNAIGNKCRYKIVSPFWKLVRMEIVKKRSTLFTMHLKKVCFYLHNKVFEQEFHIGKLLENLKAHPLTDCWCNSSSLMYSQNYACNL